MKKKTFKKVSTSSEEWLALNLSLDELALIANPSQYYNQKIEQSLQRLHEQQAMGLQRELLSVLAQKPFAGCEQVMKQKLDPPADLPKRRKPGRKHLPEDVKAWRQINKENLPREMVFQEWRNSPDVKKRYGETLKNAAENASTHFARIIKPDWYKPD